VEQQSKRDNASKTTELGRGARRVPSEQPTGSSFLDFLETTTKIIGHLLVILLVVLVTFSIAADVLNRRIIIDPVIVPKAMEDQGYTGVVAANRIASEIDRIERKTETLARKEKFDLKSESVPDVEMPETKLSLASTITFLENFLGIAPSHVGAELIFESGADWHGTPTVPPGMERVIIAIHISGKESYFRSEVTVGNPDEAVTRTAREVLEIVNPYLLGVYADDVEHDLPTSLNLMKEASDQNPSNPLIYTGWGSILNEKQDYDGAIAKYQQALALNPKYAFAYTGWGYVLDEKQDYDGAIAKYQQALALNPQSEVFRNRLAEARRRRLQ
jgi:tetratricopeptide (TPR) repeat protein